ncbi:MAG: hypothetical protein MR739_06135, partial [Spirochaetia bacterium]|nr:hypothetical protein [Spirochaetia bacterium]
FTFSPSTPSTATPRISLPFCNLLKSIKTPKTNGFLPLYYIKNHKTIVVFLIFFRHFASQYRCVPCFRYRFILPFRFASLQNTFGGTPYTLPRFK